MDFLSDLLGTPEEWNGLLAYPVQMKDYPLFLTARECISTAQQTWPVPWCAVKYFDGLIGMGLLPRLALLLKLVFRLPEELTVYPKTAAPFMGEVACRAGGGCPPHPASPGAPPQGGSQRKIVSLLVAQGDRRAEITPKNFPSLRELIARQNGIELPDEMANPELLQARNDLAQGGTPLKASLEDLICSVALKARASPGEIAEWTVRRFQAIERAIDRSDGHWMASVTIAAGGKFKGGNPFPSWKYDREEGLAGVEPLSALSGRLSGSVEKK